jgi:hypothetical protein
MSLIINLEIWFAQSLQVSRIWIKEIPIHKNKVWKNLEAPDSYRKSSSDRACDVFQTQHNRVT